MSDYIDFFDIKVNMSSKIDDWHDTLEHYNTEELDYVVNDVWEHLKLHNEMPIMANVIQEVVLGKLKNAIIASIIKDNDISEDDTDMRDKLEDAIVYDVESWTSSLTIDGVAVAKLDEVQAAVAKLVEKLIK